MTPVRRIDPERVSIDGRGGKTDITAALELALMRLKPYMQALQQHPERPSIRCRWCSCSPMGNTTSAPARSVLPSEIKSLNLDGEPVVIAVAGVSVGDGRPDEKMLRQIASPDCYVHIDNAQLLTAFIASVGSSGISRAVDVARVIKQIQA